ncbi:hypothetical protein [Kineococcus auxinigenes]|uniref:hypothetical protein n=1 Tax=unclassified Kineococcus TaxID=2621656 RepID=UPI003D7D38F1
MNGQFPSFGQPSAPDPETPVAELQEPHDREPGDGRALKSLLAGAAAVAVLGGGALGFIWLSSTPGGETADAALGGARSTPSVTVPGGADRAAVAFAANGRDVFAPTVAPTAEGAVADASTSASSTSGSGSATSASSVATSRTTAGAGTTTITTTGGGTGGKTGSPTGTSTAPSATPTDTRSTAPGWTVPQVSFVTGTDDFGTFRIAGEDVRIATGDLVYPLGIRYGGLAPSDEATTPTPSETSDDSVPAVKAVFTAENDAQTGWVITSDPEGKVLLPDAVVGHPQGRVRAYGVLADRFWIRVDRQQGVLHSEGEAVAGTGLTFLGTDPDDDSLPAAGVYFQDGSGIVYFGKFGGGESDGVAF